jgi:2',3'-cyclic-nucleotide 2'-phosphodiesterase / 3'-nucleotidase
MYYKISDPQAPCPQPIPKVNPDELVRCMTPKDQDLHLAAASVMPEITLRILATSDLHACLIGWDYFTHKPAIGRGLSRTASLITAARAEAANTLLFDNGDFLTGSGLGDYMAQSAPRDLPHPMTAAMNALGYDAVGLGNHEFSHGIAHLRRAMQGANFPLINSNFNFQDLDFVRAAVILDRQMKDNRGQIQTIRVGVLSLMPCQTLVWEAEHLHGQASAQPMLDRARDVAQDLRAQGADVVIALAHSGIAQAESTPNEENIAHLIAQIAAIDAVVAGHAHQLYASSGQGQGAAAAGAALVMPGFFGSHLGVMDLTLRQHAQGWRRVAQHTALRPIARRDAVSGHLLANVADDPRIYDLGQQTHQTISAQGTQVIGHIPHRLHSYFATISSGAAMALIAAAQSWALGAALQGTDHNDLPILSAVAPFKAGGRGGPENYTDLPAGVFRHHHAADLYIHPNGIAAFRLTGAELALWLERSVSKYSQFLAGAQDVALHNPTFPSFNCDMIFGVTYTIDLSQPPMFDTHGRVINPAARRIVDLRLDGAQVVPDQVFALASNSFRRGGQMGFAGTSDSHVLHASPQRIQDILRAYIAAGQPVPRADAGHWRFMPLPRGASALFHTSPLAAEVIDEIAHFSPLSLGMDGDGFLRYRLQF